MDFIALLKLMVERSASDLFITAGKPPSYKIDNNVVEVTKSPLSQEQSRKIVLSIMSEKQREEFERTHECQFALSVPDLGRFRVSAFTQRDAAGMVIRHIETKIPTTETLNLPDVLKELVMLKRGLIIFVGGTGTGKSTTLAALVGHRNQNSNGHIITIEDPIEFVHPHLGCIITQREVGIDTESYDIALRNALRQAPDVILIGEVRSKETMHQAITFAETGHLCLCTLHANNANQALNRIINFFPEEMHQQLFMDLSLNLRAIVAQQLVKKADKIAYPENSTDGASWWRWADNSGRYPAVEIMINTPLAADLIRRGEIFKLKDLIKNSREAGMQTFDQALFDLYEAGKISYEDALTYADSQNEVRLMIKLAADNSEMNLGDMQLSEIEAEPKGFF